MAQTKKALQTRPQIPRKLQHRKLSQMTDNMRAAGIDPSNLEMRAELLAKAKGLTGKRKNRDLESTLDSNMDEEDDHDASADVDDNMSVDDAEEPTPARKKVRLSLIHI